jgi:hypothetical protein
MSKTLKYARNGVVVGSLGFLVANLIKQLNRIEENLI